MPMVKFNDNYQREKKLDGRLENVVEDLADQTSAELVPLMRILLDPTRLSLRNHAGVSFRVCIRGNRISGACHTFQPINCPVAQPKFHLNGIWRIRGLGSSGRIEILGVMGDAGEGWTWAGQ